MVFILRVWPNFVFWFLYWATDQIPFMIFYVELSMEFRIPVLIKFLIWFFWAIYGNSINGFYISSYRSNSLFSIDLLSYRYWSNWYVLILSFWSNYEFFWHARTYWATVLIEFRNFLYWAIDRIPVMVFILSFTPHHSIYTTIGLSCTSFVRKKQLFHECD